MIPYLHQYDLRQKITMRVWHHVNDAEQREVDEDTIAQIWHELYGPCFTRTVRLFERAIT